MWCRRQKFTRKTVIQFDSNADQAEEYRALARAIEENNDFSIPEPMSQEKLEKILLEHGVVE
jgi:nitrogenase iron protein NifH